MDTRALASLVDAHRENNPTQAFDHSHVSTNHRFIWVANAKVASTTTGTALCRLDDIDLKDGNVWESENVPKLSDFTTPETLEMLSSQDWFRFCFVRNPYTRLFSAYKSKIGNPMAEPFYQIAQDEIRDAFDYPMPDGQDKPAVTFRDFVYYIRTGARSGDSHWCVQNLRLMQDLIPYDFVGRFESFGPDFREVLKRLNALANVLEMASEVRGKSASISHTAAYDQELADIVYEMYREDFDSFGYDRDSWRSEPA